jgi:DNA-binding SARP family transcriptional activator
MRRVEVTPRVPPTPECELTSVRLQLLGRFGLHVDGTPVELPEGAQRLVAFLAHHGPAPRPVIAGTLWPETPEANALASLRTSVWRLNKIRSGLVGADGLALCLAPTVSIDSQEQEAFATTLILERPDDDAWLRNGVAKLRSRDLLPGWYDDWVIFERERLGQLRLHALERAAQMMICRRDLDTALQLALEAVRSEPLRETATIVLMSVYLAEGNVADAIHQRSVFTEHLWRELHLEPSMRLTRLIPLVPAARTERP